LGDGSDTVVDGALVVAGATVVVGDDELVEMGPVVMPVGMGPGLVVVV
jgi:hypothetical protein